ncbi:NOB1 family endonuclease [Nitrosopumilus sp.]|uniref:NOB1 family endonuclease n=1 Tax=Nitrosopumilus sp. TaxID=2024843 RepID=UPI003B5A2DA8
MGFRILDASAFYAGIPFRSNNEFHTTSLVYDEIKHIKKNHNALGTLLETNRLKIREPTIEAIKSATNAAKNSGDFTQLSKQDISIIALAIEMKGEIITDDFAISNVSESLKLKISPIMTKGIEDVGKWIHYCPGCRTNHTNVKECPMCGTVLKRKLIKKKSLSDAGNQH